MELREASDEKQKGINYGMIPFKIHYFLFYGVVTGIMPCLTLLTANKFNISQSMILILAAKAQLLTLVTKTAICAIVDRFNNMKLVMIVLIVLKAFIFFILVIIPGQSPEDPTNRFSTSFTIECESNENSCRLRESICHLNYLTDGKEINKSDKSHLCNDKDFSCCAKDCRYSPHSMRTDIFRCTRLSSKPQVSRLSNYCFPFVLTAYDNSSGSFEAFFHQRETLRTLNNSTIATLCLGTENTTGWNASEILFLPNSGDSSFSCHQNQNKNHLECSAVEDLLSTEYPGSQELKARHIPQHANSQVHQPMTWLFNILWICTYVCKNGLITLSDTACHEASRIYGQDYSKQYLWGFVSSGIFEPLTIIFHDSFSGSKSNDYIVFFLDLLCFLSLVQIANLMRMNLSKPKPLKNGLEQFGKLLLSTEFVAFGIGVLFVGFLTSVVDTFLPLIVETSEVAGYSNYYIELIYATWFLISGLPFMYFSGWIINNIGYTNVLVIVSLCYSVRFLWYSFFLSSSIWIPTMEITHGFLFGVFYVAMTTFAKSVAPVGMEASTQSLLSCTFSGLGPGLFIAVQHVCSDNMKVIMACILLGLSSAALQYALSKIRAERTECECGTRMSEEERLTDTDCGGATC